MSGRMRSMSLWAVLVWLTVAFRVGAVAPEIVRSTVCVGTFASKRKASSPMPYHGAPSSPYPARTPDSRDASHVTSWNVWSAGPLADPRRSRENGPIVNAKAGRTEEPPRCANG